MNDLLAVVPVVSLKVMVHVTVPDQVGLVSTTLGLRVRDVSELIVTFAAQLLSPLFQVTLPLAAPVQVDVIWVTLLKLLPTADMLAS